MPKVKTCKTAAKRLKLSKNKKVLRRKAGKSHLLSGKSPKCRRLLRRDKALVGKRAASARRALGKG
jgi:large subunit ribosomal protein L35